MSMEKVKVRGQRSRSQSSNPILAVFRLWLWLFEFTYDEGMMQKAWCCLEEVLYCFSRSYIKFQCRKANKIIVFYPTWVFPDCYSSLNSPMAMIWYTKLEEVYYCFSMSSVKFQGHTGQKIADFDLNWAFPDCNSSLNSLMAMKWCTKLEVAEKKCADIACPWHSIEEVPYCFSRSSNFKVTRDKKLPILTPIERFQTVTLVWIHQWF